MHNKSSLSLNGEFVFTVTCGSEYATIWYSDNVWTVTVYSTKTLRLVWKLQIPQ